jgi:hypothetical protein
LSTSFLEDSRVLLEPFLEVFEFSFTFVGNSGLVVSWVPHESWISFDLNTIGLVDGGIKFGNDKVWLILVASSELLPDWGELLAVSTPWSVELDEDILSFVKDEALEFSSDNINNVTLFGWWSSRLEMGFEGSGVDSVNEFANAGNSDLGGIAFISVFLHVSWKDGSKGWEILWGNTHEFSKLSLDLVGSSSIGEEDLTLVLSGSFSIKVHVIRLVIILASEQNEGALLLSENGFDLILGECKDGWNLEWLDPGSKSVLISSSVVDVLLGLELSEENESISRDTVFSGTGGIRVVELNLLFVLGESDMSISVDSIVKSSEVDESKLIRGSLLSNLSAGELS